jgi:ATP-dependent DNA ligase
LAIRPIHMAFPFDLPIEPMLAKASDKLPEGGDWIYEPKWDGFRAMPARDGDAIELWSRDKKPLVRYFPELLEPLREMLPERCVLDGEIVIAGARGLEFESLLLRVHPAESRIRMLSKEIPASVVLWDILALGDDDLRSAPFEERRATLERALAGVRPPVYLTPCTRDREIATDWFHRFEGAGLDGVIAKRPSDTYQPGKRIMQKIKHARTAECVVGGFRWHKNGPGTMVGSLLLGLFDDEGALHHVGIAASFTAQRRKELAAELAPLREGALVDHPWKSWAEAQVEQRMPGGGSRWNRGKDMSWEPLRAELVCEVAYDHLQGTRFRHATHFVRWRPDKPPSECRYDQLESTPPAELASIFGAETIARPPA